MPVDEVLQAAVDFVCPFCQRRASAGFMGEKPCVMHAMPECEKFMALEPDEYLSQVNDARSPRR